MNEVEGGTIVGNPEAMLQAVPPMTLARLDVEETVDGNTSAQISMVPVLHN